MSESIRYVVDRGLGHQAEDIHHAVRNLAAAHRFFDEFRQPFFRSDPWPQALRRSWPLCLHAIERRERLLHSSVAALGGRFLSQSHKRRADQRLQFRLTSDSQLTADATTRLHQL